MLNGIGIGVPFNKSPGLNGAMVGLFAAGEQGVWYDPSDFSTMFQDSAGTTAAAIEQPVGLLLDKSKGLVLGDELVTNGGFGTDTTWVKPVGATISGGELVLTSVGTGAQTYQDVSLPAGTYEFTFTITEFTAGGVQAYLHGSGAAGTSRTAPGTYTEKLHPTITSTRIALRSIGTTTAKADNVSVKLLPGNHATQATSTARPVLRARYNLLTYSEAFDNANWQTACTVTPNAIVAPDGTTTADLLVVSGTGDRKTQTFTAQAAGSITFSVYVKSYDGNTDFKLLLFNFTTALSLGSGSVTKTISAGETAGNGWYRHSITVSGGFSVGDSLGAYIYIDGTNTVGSGNYFWGAQVNPGSTALPYQRIAAATDYDTVGFLQAADYDGVDDHSDQSAGGGSTTQFFLCAGIKPEGGAGAVRVLWSDAGTNTGYIVRLNASNQLELAAGNATAYTTIATVATLSVGTAYVVTVWDDGTNLNVQVNSGAVASVARPVVAAGTATASIGSDNGAATGWFNGLIYSLIQVKNDAGTAAERDATKAYVASKAGVTL